MEHKKILLDLQTFPKKIRGALYKCKELTEEAVSYREVGDFIGMPHSLGVTAFAMFLSLNQSEDLHSSLSYALGLGLLDQFC